MLQRLGHAGRLVIALQRRQLAERGALHVATSDASGSSLKASLWGRPEHTDATAAATAATKEAASAGATDASAGAASGKHTETTPAAESATAEAASAGATDAPSRPASGQHTDTAGTVGGSSAGARNALAKPTSGEDSGATAAAEAATAEAASAGAVGASARQTSGKRSYTTAAADAATAEAASAGATDASAEATSGGAERRAAVNRLMYRSKQRGFLELDLLVGLWAERNVPRMSLPQLRAFEEVLDIENPDLFKWLTGQEPAPDALRDNASFTMLRSDVKQQIEEHRSSEAQTPSGAAWVRGWDDWKSGQLKG